MQRINHELAKLSISNPSFMESIDGSKHSDRDRTKIKKYILYALGLDEDDGEASSEESDDATSAKSTDSDTFGENSIRYGVQRMYGRHPSRIADTILIQTAGGSENVADSKSPEEKCLTSVVSIAVNQAVGSLLVQIRNIEIELNPI